MADRVTNNNSGNVQHVASSSSAPPEGAALNQAAADFASLLGDDTQSTVDTSANTGLESRDARPQDDRVEKRDERQESGDDRDNSGGDKQEKKKGETQSKDAPSPGDAILQSLAKGEAAAGKVDATSQVQGANTLEGVVQQVVDKMLVSDVSGGREVRIFLKDSALPGTEVRITQNAGKMQVQFVTDSSKSQDILAQNQAALQQRMNEKLSTEVVVSVEMESQGHGDQPQGESRGKQDQQTDDDDA